MGVGSVGRAKTQQPGLKMPEEVSMSTIRLRNLT